MPCNTWPEAILKNKTKARQKLDKSDSDKIPLRSYYFFGCKEVFKGDMILMKRDTKTDLKINR